MADLQALQNQVYRWAVSNFGANRPAYHPLLGVMEEAGELAHAHLKEEQNIRREEDHVANARDAVGDVVIFLMDYCNLRGWSLEECVMDAWAQVGSRNLRTEKKLSRES